MFDAFITAEQAREQEFGQGDQDEEEDLPEPLCFVFSIRAAIMKDHVARKSSSIPKFSSSDKLWSLTFSIFEFRYRIFINKLAYQ
jgi:hypothetical protein